jgi:CRISPR-associated endonuclease/helicase Cas3
MDHYAHSNDGPPEGWQPLEEHLRAVSQRAGDFADAFGARAWGEIAGRWHDLGKYSEAFQRYLRGGDDACAETTPGRVDHSTAGAQHAAVIWPVLGILAAYAIAGHHGGLPDAMRRRRRVG